MTRTLSPENQAALQAGQLIERDFVWFVVRDWETGEDVTDGYWSDIGTRVFPVIDPETGGSQDRELFGADGLIEISDIPHVSTLSVQQVTIKLSQVSDRVNDLLRSYDCKQGRVEIYRGLFDPDTRNLVAPAYGVFVGYIDEAPINTPAENEQGDVTLTCTSHTQEITRTNPDTRSHASQQLRAPGDTIFTDTTVVKDWVLWWGKSPSTAPGASQDDIWLYGAKAMQNGGLFK